MIGTGVYVHVPFCLRKCPYCDFNSYPLDPALTGPYTEALLAEARARRGEGPASTAYFGGGTPTCLDCEGLSRLIAGVLDLFGLPLGAEVSVEANPGTLDSVKAKTLRAAGVTRISLGFQALDDEVLRRAGRIHTAPEAVDAFHVAREAGFPEVSVDLMYGLPGQTLVSFRETLERVVGLGPEHISTYPLTLEEGTPMAKGVSSGLVSLPPEAEEEAMGIVLQEVLLSGGYERYEISSFSLPGHECRHNLGYWMGSDYAGLGAGAHSLRKNKRWWNLALPEEYVAGISRGTAVASGEELTPHQVRAERVILALRTSWGLDLGAFEGEFGEPLETVYPGVVERLEGLGLVALRSGCLRLSERGFALANRVFLEFA